MAARKVQVFFYGSYMSLNVLEAAGLKRRPFAPASIQGFELSIQPFANLVESGDGVVYGILANLTHAELDLLYGPDAERLAGHSYLPEAVLVHTRGGKIVPATVYICHDMERALSTQDYVDGMLKTARDYGFPRWYQENISAFRPA
ncbi:MAG: gamma-glutamylcyclotransferase [Alphaproteobacteria bacterium]|nr:MAG: gamma-glutamylcyclotransferase [Alphaproteobacteria bacterium]